MRKHIFHILVLWSVSGFGMLAHAGELVAAKTILLVEFGEASPLGSKLSDAIQQAQKDFPILEYLPLADESALESVLEKRTDDAIGMVVLMHPQEGEVIHKLPGLYPDIAFTVIDTPHSNYATNVQTVQFKEENGIFLLGAIAAIRNNGGIAVLNMGDDAYNRMLVDRFIAGVAYVHPQSSPPPVINIINSANQATIEKTVADAFQGGVSIIFSMNPEIVEPALRAAKPERKMVISGIAPDEMQETSRLLTYMVKRYDLALLQVLHIYQHGQWRPGTIFLGVQGGYVDYALNAENVDLFPKESIDQIEATKDYIGQGIVSKTP